MGRQMHVDTAPRPNKGAVGISLLAVVTLLQLGISGLANAPTLSDLKVVSVSSSSSGNAWVVQLTLDVSHQPLAAVSNLTLRAYDQLGGQVAEYIDHPFHPHSGSFVDDYHVLIEIPKEASGRITIEACAKHENDWGCTTWQGWIPQEPRHVFSGGLEFKEGTEPRAVGMFESTQWILSIEACGATAVTLHTLDCRLVCKDPAAEIPTWWRVWDSNSDGDGKLEAGEIVDTGWIPVADFITHWNLYEIEVPTGWSGKIRFQLRMERSGLADHAGTYSATLRVDVCDGL